MERGSSNLVDSKIFSDRQIRISANRPGSCFCDKLVITLIIRYHFCIGLDYYFICKTAVLDNKIPENIQRYKTGCGV